MKKLFVFLFISLLLVSSAYAEIGATAYSNDPQYDEQSVFVIAYNNSGSSITSNAVVVLDTTAANVTSGATLGARITTSTDSGNSFTFLGITDQTIADNSAGRICVRGPHKALFSTALGSGSAGASLAVGFTAGYLANHPARAPLSTTTGASIPVVAVMLSATQTQDVSVAGKEPATEPANLYWVWVK